MPLPSTSYVQFTPDMRICRALNGLWQVSGAHGPINPQAALSAMFAYHDAGFTTWDLADHYGPAEDLVGVFRRRLLNERGEAALANQFFTKWVPRPGPMTRRVVEAAIDLSLRRMGTDILDLLQFHWWEYADPGYLEALSHLAALRDAGKIRHLALTNFDTAHMRVIAERGIKVVSNQVQYSLIDTRPEVKMVRFCQEQGSTLLAYGVLCGGLLSDRYLGRPEPTRSELNTASLHKYKQMIDLWGGWGLFQELLTTLRAVADGHRTTIAAVAVRAILDQPAVSGVIVGTRLGVSEHIAATTAALALQLTPDDTKRIAAMQRQGEDLYKTIGDCGDEYRR
jgi:aryl-alcohol dehydrogenase-like predicted oxidoreductase